ncbi:MAG: DNA-binding transcriptional LysR family regulator [Desulforhopalus sp.]|jgi:DNA-binding transcriptional LysR family regulator
MQSFDIVTLRVFLAVARLGSIGAAARCEYIAASAASRRVSDLEHDLDTVLIKRTPAGTSLTSAGKAFAVHCEQLLNKYADVRADLKRFADGEAGDFRIAATPRAVDGTLPSVVARFKKDNPAVRVTMQEIFSRQGIRYLREDLADLAIIYDSVDMKGFEILPYKEDPIWIVGKKDHPLFIDHSDDSTVYFTDTLAYDHISFHEGGVLDELIAEARRKKGRSSKYDIKVLRVNSLLKCVEAGLGLGVIGQRDLQPHLQNSNLKNLRLADSWAARNLVCVFPKGQAASPTVRMFLKYLAEGD